MSSASGRLKDVQNTILVMSGKGGVGKAQTNQCEFQLNQRKPVGKKKKGKSTVAVQLANALVARGKRVGLLDVDLTGPSVPRLVGLSQQAVHKASDGWVPVFADATQRLAVMSIQFLLKSADDPIIWRGPKKNAVIRQFLEDVLWGELDFLIVDTPPGTSDEHISTCELLLAAAKAPRALLVTTPQAVALADVRKEAAFCRQMALPILGIIENMSGYVCTHCRECTNIFSSDGGRLLAAELAVPFAGRVPIDPSVAACEDAGQNFFLVHPDSETLASVAAVAAALCREQEEQQQQLAQQ